MYRKTNKKQQQKLKPESKEFVHQRSGINSVAEFWFCSRVFGEDDLVHKLYLL